jgi:two-component system phosphate regulon response regulator PhoB
LFKRTTTLAMDKLIHIVEDDDDIRFIVEYILLESGYRVESSANAREFNEQMIDHRPDLILMDVMLPDGNGIDLCRNLKSNPEKMDIKIIIMSAHAAEQAVLNDAHADDFVGKPFDLDYLTERVKNLVGSVD